MAGTRYMTCNGDGFNFVIEDKNGNELLKDSYTDYAVLTAYSFDVRTAGYYYVKITGIIPTSTNYLFNIGSPTYSLSHYEIPCKEVVINMTSADEIKDGLISMNMPVASMWTANLAYSNATSFTPVVKIYYAYPVYSTKVRQVLFI